jgi:hypothetical protein
MDGFNEQEYRWRKLASLWTCGTKSVEKQGGNSMIRSSKSVRVLQCGDAVRVSWTGTR